MATPEEITRHHDPDPDEDPWVQGPPPPETIAVVPYDDRWPDRCRALAADLSAALGPAAVDIDHVGSTAVPGLAAKDLIDIDLTVVDPRREDDYVPAMEALGYVLRVREPSWHQHRLLRLEEPRANVHVFGPGCPEVIRHRLFRDWLRTHPDDLALYAEAKRAAVPGGGSVVDYNQRKEEVIRQIYDRAFHAAGLLSDEEFSARVEGRSSS